MGEGPGGEWGWRVGQGKLSQLGPEGKGLAEEACRQTNAGVGAKVGVCRERGWEVGEAGV